MAGDLRGVVDVTGLLAIISMERGEEATAADLYEKALSLARQIGHRRAEATNLVNLANVQYFQGRLGDALNNYRLAAEASNAIGDRRSAALVRANTASVRHLLLGDDESAETEARAALDYFQSEDHQWGAALCYETLAGISHRYGNSGLARHISKRVLASSREASTGGWRRIFNAIWPNWNSPRETSRPGISEIQMRPPSLDSTVRGQH